MDKSNRSTFVEKLRAAIAANQTLLCVGLDPDLASLPEGVDRSAEGVAAFNRAIVEATGDLVCAYKPNLAFYEVLGPDGWTALRETIRAIPPRIPIIADAKRGDVPNTARLYACAIFEVYGCDAVTVSPYLGRDALEPYLAYADRGVLVLCRTSNPGAGEVQNLPVLGADRAQQPLYEQIAERARAWNERGNCGLVVGATAPDELHRIRALAPDLPILVLGIGAQGGDLAAAVAVHREHAPAIISASRSVLSASSGADYAQAARESARRLREQIRELRDRAGAPAGAHR